MLPKYLPLKMQGTAIGPIFCADTALSVVVSSLDDGLKNLFSMSLKEGALILKKGVIKTTRWTVVDPVDRVVLIYERDPSQKFLKSHS